jgi:hypothetical protein
LASDLFTKWLKPESVSTAAVHTYSERKGKRLEGLALLKPLLADHFVGEMNVMKLGGYEKAAAVIVNSLPTSKRTQSGDLGELLATEYVNSETPYKVPIKKLRWKSDRQMPMHGNDVLGIDSSTSPPKVLKCECKSRGQFSPSAVKDASDGLDLHDGRPNPSTLAFITKRLLEENRDAEAKLWIDLQTKDNLPAGNITQMIFGLAGNSPQAALAKCPKSKFKAIKRQHAGISVPEYADFIASVYTS